MSPPCTAMRNSTAVGASPGMVTVVVPSVMTTMIAGRAPNWNCDGPGVREGA